MRAVPRRPPPTFPPGARGLARWAKGSAPAATKPSLPERKPRARALEEAVAAFAAAAARLDAAADEAAEAAAVGATFDSADAAAAATTAAPTGPLLSSASEPPAAAAAAAVPAAGRAATSTTAAFSRRTAAAAAARSRVEAARLARRRAWIAPGEPQSATALRTSATAATLRCFTSSRPPDPVQTQERTVS